MHLSLKSKAVSQWQSRRQKTEGEGITAVNEVRGKFHDPVESDGEVGTITAAVSRLQGPGEKPVGLVYGGFYAYRDGQLKLDLLQVVGPDPQGPRDVKNFDPAEMTKAELDRLEAFQILNPDG